MRVVGFITQPAVVKRILASALALQDSSPGSPQSLTWPRASLIKKIYGKNPMVCHHDGGAMRVLALITAPESFQVDGQEVAEIGPANRDLERAHPCRVAIILADLAGRAEMQDLAATRRESSTGSEISSRFQASRRRRCRRKSLPRIRRWRT